MGMALILPYSQVLSKEMKFFIYILFLILTTTIVLGERLSRMGKTGSGESLKLIETGNAKAGKGFWKLIEMKNAAEKRNNNNNNELLFHEKGEDYRGFPLKACDIGFCWSRAKDGCIESDWCDGNTVGHV